MNLKISAYLFSIKLKYIFLTLLFITLFIQIINILEVSKVINNENFSLTNLIYLSFLKLPTTILEILPFAIVISTAFFYRYLISNNELISMRNVGFSILDIFKPVAIAIFFLGLIFLLLVNPISSIFENKFEIETSKDNSNLYSIKISNNEIWIKNLNEDKNNFIKFSNFDLKRMYGEDIKIIESSEKNNKFYLAEKGYLNDKNLKLKNIKYFNIDDEKLIEIKDLNLKVNFIDDDIINSISDYKHIPFYNYNKHLKSLKKFNLYSPEISFYYMYQIFKPIFLVMLSFVVMGYASRFKRNENFFKILFISMSVGFCFFILKEVLSAIIMSNYLSFWLGYVIMIIITIIIGLYQSINIEIK
tara:strand:- start:354 stop:1433 length:1080 start_codon:yes stop_codon:yes gene_type:complete